MSSHNFDYFPPKHNFFSDGSLIFRNLDGHYELFFYKLHFITPQEYLVFYTLSGVVHTRRSQNITQRLQISLQNTTEIVVRVAAVGIGGRRGRKSAALQVETIIPFQGFFPAMGIESTVLDLRASAVSQTSVSILWKPPTQSSAIQV